MFLRKNIFFLPSSVSGTAYERNITESIGISDALDITAFTVILREVADSLGISDSATGENVGVTIREIADALGISDYVDAKLQSLITREVTDSIGITDSAEIREFQESPESIFSQPFYLFELIFSSPIYYTDTDITVVWSGNSYLPIPISIGGFGKSSTNISETLAVKTHNVDRIFATIVLNEDIQGKQANIYRTTWMAPGSYSNPVLVFKGQFDSLQIEDGYDKADINFDIRNDFVRWDRTVSRANFGGVCQWDKFKSNTPGCQYTGAASLCNRTWERCTELDNTHRFRGFRWLPMLQDKEIWWGRNPKQ